MKPVPPVYQVAGPAESIVLRLLKMLAGGVGVEGVGQGAANPLRQGLAQLEKYDGRTGGNVR